MTFKKLTTSAAVIASLLAANLSPLAATAASAHDGWRKGGHHNHGYSRSYNGHRHYKGNRHYHGPRYRHGHRHHNRGRDVATGLAIGLGVLAVGSIIASGR